MKAHYGLLLAMLLGSGQLIAAEATGEQDAAPYIEQEQEQSGAAQSAAVEQSGFSSGSVMRSAFTTRIDDREPVDDVSSLENDTQEVFYFTELRDMEGQTAKHRWKYQGEVMAEVEFDVKGPRWRVWSSKRFVPDWTGEWTVSVVNAADEVITEDTLQYVAGTEAEAAGNADSSADMEKAGNADMENPQPGMQ